MKKNTRISNSLSLLLLLLTLFSVMGQTARVKFVIGRVEYRKTGGQTWLRVRMRTVFNQGDQLRTSFESRIEIRTGDETIVRLGENSLLDLNMLKKRGKKKTANKFKLWGGSLWAKFTKLFSSDEEENTISTPTAVAAIRGTVLEVKHDESTAKSEFNLIEGLIEVRTLRANRRLEAGKRLEVEKDGTSKESKLKERDKNKGDKFYSNEDKKSKSSASIDTSPNFLQLDEKSREILDEKEIVSGLAIRGRTRGDAKLLINGQAVQVESDGRFTAVLNPREGKLSVRVSSSSKYGNVERSLEFKVNTSQPELFISMSEGQTYTNESNYHLSIHGNDGTSGDVLTLSINGNIVKTGTSPLNSSSYVSLSLGSNMITVLLEDEVGHVVSKDFEIILDNIAPRLIVSPSSIAPILPTSSFGDTKPPSIPSFPYRVHSRQIIGQVIDQGLNSVEEIFINGEQVLVENGNFLYLLELNNEIIREYYERKKRYFEINFVVKDRAGNELIQTERIEIVRLSE